MIYMAGVGDAISKDVYEAGKNWRLIPERIRPLGYYTLRALNPPDYGAYAFQEMVDISVVHRVLKDLYRIEFTEFPDREEPRTQESYFTSDGFMINLNDNPRLPNLPDLLEIGYVLNPHAADA